jgi:hypothetical protein
MTRSKKRHRKSKRAKSLSPRSKIPSHRTRRTRSHSPIRRTPTSLERAHSWRNPTGLTRFHQFNNAAGDPIPGCCTLSNRTTISELKVQISQMNGVNPRNMLIYSTKYKKPLGNKRNNLLKIKNSLFIIIDPAITPENLSQNEGDIRDLLYVLRQQPTWITIPDLVNQLLEDDPDIRDMRSFLITETTTSMNALIEDGLVLEKSDENRLNTLIREHAQLDLPVPPSVIASCKKYIINIKHPYFEARPHW